MDQQTPVFVKVEDYKDVLDIIDLIRNKLDEAKSAIHHINELKSKEDAELELWYQEVADITRKVEFIDKTLFEPENV